DSLQHGFVLDSSLADLAWGSGNSSQDFARQGCSKALEVRLHYHHAQSHASTPHQASMPTPAASVPTPTPSASTPAQTSMVPPQRPRRFGISEPSSEIKPANLATPPASTSAAAHTSPATPASPPKGKPVRKMPKPRKPSKAGDTPTPVPEPVTTPTPVATTSHKRPLDEAETPASQSEAPQLKRPKTEPVNPPVPIKVPTPPSVLSAPVDRSTIKTEEDANALLAESFKKVEESDAGLSSQTQFIDWITQLVSNPASTSSAPTLMTTETQISVTNDGDGLFDGGGIDFFNWNDYYSESDPPSMPELENPTTVSPESHNGATTTPPSQSTAARPGTGNGRVNAAAVVPLTASTSTRDVKNRWRNPSPLPNRWWQSYYTPPHPVEPLTALCLVKQSLINYLNLLVVLMWSSVTLSHCRAYFFSSSSVPLLIPLAIQTFRFTISPREANQFLDYMILMEESCSDADLGYSRG
ncbi:15755_t:CDS:2, partial [Acaulospora colombiana]